MYANLINLGSTSHTYTGVTGGAGANSVDGNFTTYQAITTGDVEVKPGTASATCISQHVFSTAYTVGTVRYKLYSYSYFTFSGITAWTLRLEYTTDGTTWNTITGTERTGSTSAGSGGGTHTDDQGDTTVTTNLPSCLGVRAYVSCYGSDDDGHVGATARIYEVQAFPLIRRSYAGIV